jgi:hypothetical protein
MRAALESAAALLSGGRADAETLPWWALHYQHMSALRARLVARAYAPATGNRILAAVWGVSPRHNCRSIFGWLSRPYSRSAHPLAALTI